MAPKEKVAVEHVNTLTQVLRQVAELRLVHGTGKTNSARGATTLVLACATTTLLTTYPFFHLVFVLQLGDPGVVLGFVGVGAVGTTITLHILTLRTILEAAVSNRLELDEVI